jgi:CRISPR/Cas system type I-B associated protein Csh2 (Cas7 group RAMP superfamily)
MKAGYKVPIFKNDARSKRRSDATNVVKAYYSTHTSKLGGGVRNTHTELKGD